MYPTATLFWFNPFWRGEEEGVITDICDNKGGSGNKSKINNKTKVKRGVMTYFRKVKELIMYYRNYPSILIIFK